MAQTQGTGKGNGTGRSAAAGVIGGAIGRLGRWGGLVFLLAGLALSGWGAYEGVYLAGWAGNHGTLTVKQCDVSYPGASHRRRTNHRLFRCDGSFVSDDGGSRDASASVQAGHRYAQGTELSVQQAEAPSTDTSADGGYVQVGMDRAWRFFGAFFGGWVLSGLGVFCLATGYTPFGQSRVSYDTAWDAAGRGVTRPILIGMIGVGIVGAGLSFLVSYFV
jgi:hypothetical protein